jgi:hypothetical protein
MTRLIRYGNNATATIAANISNSATTLLLTPGHGSRFPSLSAGQFFRGTLIKADGTKEIVNVTARATDTLTIQRAVEPIAGVTTAYSFLSGDKFELRMTAGSAVVDIDRLDYFDASGNIVLGPDGSKTFNIGTGQIVKDASGNVDFSGELTVNGLKVGRGSGNLSLNVALGTNALGASNTGVANVAIGPQALVANTSGTQNIGVGQSSLEANTTGGRNTAVGVNALVVSNGSENSALGRQAGAALTSGSTNTFIGHNSGSAVTSGNNHTILGGYIGNQGGLDIRTASGFVVLSDGAGNLSAVFNQNGDLAIGSASNSSIGSNYKTVKLNGLNGSGYQLYTNETLSANIYVDSSGFLIDSVGAKPTIFSNNSVVTGRFTPDNNFLIGSSTNSGQKVRIESTSTQFALTYPGGSTYGSFVNSSGSLLVNRDGNDAFGVTSAGNFSFNSGYGSVSTAYAVRAWVNFNGQGVVAIKGSGNVSSITDNGVGDYTVNYTTALPDANYSVSGFGVGNSSTNVSGASMVTFIPTGSGTYDPLLKSTTQSRICVGNPFTGALNDCADVSFSVVR